MNSKRRILTALNHEQPDRVPIFELQIDEPIVWKRLGVHSGLPGRTGGRGWDVRPWKRKLKR